MVMIDKSWYTRPPGVPAKIAAGGVVVRLEGDDLCLALVKEQGRPGYILPKGKVKKHETLEQAARREIMEEAGLGQLKLRKYLGMRERMDFRKKRWKITHYFLFETSEHKPGPTDPYRQYSVQWFVPENLPSMFWPEQKELIESNLDVLHAIREANR